MKIHELSDVQSTNIGKNTTIWQYVVILPKANIGENCNINCHVFIENDVIIGNNVTIKSGVQIWDGICIEDNVFIGPNVTFTNDLVPRSKQYPETFRKTILKKGSSIGANATLLSGIEIGEYALVGSGSVLTKTIENNSVWYGNPAVKMGYVTDEGILLDLTLTDKKGNKYKFIEGKITQ
jgi:acetyltransferase-like isoleucine patch superfamily enzyme